MFWKAINIMSFKMLLQNYFKSLKAEILDFGIVDISEASDIHIKIRSWIWFLTLLTWKCLT